MKLYDLYLEGGSARIGSMFADQLNVQEGANGTLYVFIHLNQIIAMLWNIRLDGDTIYIPR